MRKGLVDILCCPLCKSDLRLEAKRLSHEEVLDGTLTCTKCATEYPISEGIPNLLPPGKR